MEETERAYLSLGKIQYGILPREEKNVQFKRSVYAVKEIKKGEPFTPENIRVIRPGDGLHPRHYEELLDKNAHLDISMGTPLNWELVN